jgi:hypothetical protein
MVTDETQIKTKHSLLIVEGEFLQVRADSPCFTQLENESLSVRICGYLWLHFFSLISSITLELKS